MNDDSARRFARRMIDTWPAGPKGYVWEELAKPLEVEAARRAIQELERTLHRPPTTGQFFGAYNEARSHDAIEERPMHCELCDDTGFVDATKPDDESSSSRPCKCSRGRQVELGYRRTAGIAT